MSSNVGRRLWILPCACRRRGTTSTYVRAHTRLCSREVEYLMVCCASSADSRAGLSIAKAAFLMELEEPELALDAIGNALTSNPALPAAFMMKSKVYSHIGQHDRAAESLQEMVTVLGDVCQRCKDTPVNTIACKRCSRRAACSHRWCCVSGRGLRRGCR